MLAALGSCSPRSCTHQRTAAGVGAPARQLVAHHHFSSKAKNTVISTSWTIFVLDILFYGILN